MALYFGCVQPLQEGNNLVCVKGLLIQGKGYICHLIKGERTNQNIYQAYTWGGTKEGLQEWHKMACHEDGGYELRSKDDNPS